MLKHLSTLHRRQSPQTTTALTDRRSGAPARRRPDPMPRMRWYA